MLHQIHHYHKEVSQATQIIGELSATMNQEVLETAKYKALLVVSKLMYTVIIFHQQQVLQALDNHISSLWTQTLEEVHQHETRV